MKYPLTRLAKWLNRTKGKKHSKTRAKFYKCLLVIVEIYAMSLIGMSYYLAYLGHTELLENLSQTITKVIVYPFIAYTINRTIENYAEHNITQFHKPLSEAPIEESEEADG